MTAFPSKVLVIFISIGVLALTCFTALAANQQLIDTRVKWNITTNFVDVVADKGILNESDYEEYINRLNATGAVYNVVITLAKKTVVPSITVAGDFDITYPVYRIFSTEQGGVNEITYLSAGDEITIHVETLSPSLSSKLIAKISGVGTGDTDLYYFAKVRNDGR